MDGPFSAVVFSTVSPCPRYVSSAQVFGIDWILPLYQEWSKLRCGGVSPEGLPVLEFFGREGCLFV